MERSGGPRRRRGDPCGGGPSRDQARPRVSCRSSRGRGGRAGRAGTPAGGTGQLRCRPGVVQEGHVRRLRPAREGLAGAADIRRVHRTPLSGGVPRAGPGRSGPRAHDRRRHGEAVHRPRGGARRDRADLARRAGPDAAAGARDHPEAPGRGRAAPATARIRAVQVRGGPDAPAPGVSLPQRRPVASPRRAVGGGAAVRRQGRRQPLFRLSRRGGGRPRRSRHGSSLARRPRRRHRPARRLRADDLPGPRPGPVRLAVRGHPQGRVRFLRRVGQVGGRRVATPDRVSPGGHPDAEAKLDGRAGRVVRRQSVPAERGHGGRAGDQDVRRGAGGRRTC